MGVANSDNEVSTNDNEMSPGDNDVSLGDNEASDDSTVEDTSEEAMVTTTGLPTGVPPVRYNGTMYHSRAAAHVAALLDLQHVRFSYRAHRLLLQPGTVTPHFWVPAHNLFLWVEHTVPTLHECTLHAAVATLGHDVAVLVGDSLGAIVPQKVGEPVLRGWTLRAFDATMRMGWCGFVYDTLSNSVTFGNVTDPTDAAARHTVVLTAMKQARESVDTVDATIDLARTLGKTLRIK